MRKQVILLVTTFVFAMALCGAVAAEDKDIEGDYGVLSFNQSSLGQTNSSNQYPDSNCDTNNSNIQTNNQTNSQNGLVDPQILIIHSSTSSKMTNDAAHNIMNLINPTQLGYNPNNKSTWLTRFDIRSTSQIGEMSPDALKSLIESADIIICEWLFEPGLSNFKNVITANPNILKNKPNKIFLVLESEKELTKLSQINGQMLFDGVPDDLIGSTSTANTILYDLKNANIQRLNNYRTTYPQISKWIDAGLYYANKGTINYEYQYKWALKDFTEANGGTWPSQWNPSPYTVLPKEMLYRNGVIYTSLADYLAQYPINPSKATVGIVDMDSPLLAGNMDHFETLINKLVAQGLNIIPVVGAYSGTSGTQPLNIYSAMVKFFVYNPANPNSIVTTSEYEANPQNYKYRIDSLVSFYTFSLGSGFIDQTNALLENMNVPVFRAMTSTKRTEGEWLVSDDGLIWSDTYYQIAVPETQGIVEPIFVATTENTFDPVTGANLTSYKAIPDRMDKLAARIKNWTDLKYMDNSNKKIALIYYNYPPGKQNIGASYLNVPESIIQILNQLKQEGYTVTDIPQTSDELVSLMIERGINVANWAPGELQKLADNPNTILWDAEEYEAWFNSLNPVAQKQVTEGPVGYIEEITKIAVEYGQTDETAKDAAIKTIDKWTQEMISLANTYPEKSQQAVSLINEMGNALKEVINGNNSAWNNFFTAKNAFLALAIPGLTGWGQAPGNIMTVTKNGKKYIVIPGLKFGNVFIGPEPQRGWEADASKFYHSTIVPPHHQYLAWYAWINQELNADAQVHLGRHASYEWLPNKQVALASFDYSDIMIADTPSVYIYIIDGVGEGMQSKRRGLAVIIDHLTPPLKTTTLYGGFIELKGLLDDYEKTPAGNPMKEEYMAQIKQKIKEMHLETDLGISDVNNITDEEIEKAHEYLLDLQQTLMPYGLHTFGTRWTDNEIALLATSMVSADGGISNPSLQRLLAGEKGWDFDNLTLDQAEQLNNQAQNWILQLFTGAKTASELTYNLQIQAKLIEALGFAMKIDESFNSEVNALIDALNGGYITPSTGNDPIRNTESIPTGKNFYSLSENQIPTKTAWNLGKKLADMALAQLDVIPEKIAAVVWCVETARDDGTMASFVLRMLGIEPTWTSSGNVDKMKATPLDTLLADLNTVRAANGLPALTQRPRIDVVVTTSGLFRDLFPRLLINMDRSNRVALAASYNTIVAQHPKLQSTLDYVLQTLVDAKYTNYKGSEPIEQNYIAKHWIESTNKYIAQGILPNDAGELAITRIFAPPVGDYGAGVNKAVEQSWTWENREEVADVYINRMSHAYSERNWGVSNPDLFKDLLKGIDTAYHSRSTNLYGVLDNDDYYDYYGGLSMAIEKMNNGNAPNLNVVYYANPSNPKVMSLQSFMTQEMRSRYYNPEWIGGMMKEGYSGARYISNKFVSYLWGWQVTSPDTVENWMWDEVVNTYIKDQHNIGVDEWLSNGNNAYAMISITGTLLTAANKGYWSTDEATLKLVANKWAKLIAENGVACCDCSCGNIAMMKWATQYINPDILAQFKSQIYAATRNEGFAPTNPNQPTQPGQPNQPGQPEQPGQPSQPGQPGQTGQPEQPDQSESNAGTTPGEQQVSAATTPGEEGDQGQSHEINPVDQQNSSEQTGMPIAAIVGVVLIVGLIGVGYFRTSIMGFLRR